MMLAQMSRVQSQSLLLRLHCSGMFESYLRRMLGIANTGHSNFIDQNSRRGNKRSTGRNWGMVDSRAQQKLDWVFLEGKLMCNGA